LNLLIEVKFQPFMALNLLLRPLENSALLLGLFIRRHWCFLSSVLW